MTRQAGMTGQAEITDVAGMTDVAGFLLLETFFIDILKRGVYYSIRLKKAWQRVFLKKETVKNMEKALNFLKSAKKELDKVKWPTKKQTINHTKLVVIVSLAVALFLGTLDFIFNSLVTKIL